MNNDLAREKRLSFIDQPVTGTGWYSQSAANSAICEVDYQDELNLMTYLAKSA